MIVVLVEELNLTRGDCWDLGAGFPGWTDVAGFCIVTCAVYDLTTHESVELVCAADSRADGIRRLKEAGVHRFEAKDNVAPPDAELVDVALRDPGRVFGVRR